MSWKRRAKFWIILNLLVPPASLFLRALSATWKLDPHDAEELARLYESTKGSLIAISHGQILMALAFHDVLRVKGHRLYGLSSPSKDGLVLDKFLTLLGVTPLKGSSKSRAAAGLRSVVSTVQEGGSVVITVDGPKGPRLVPKAGIIGAAWLAKTPINVLAFRPSSARVFRTWDRFQVPSPFSTIEVSIHPLALPDRKESTEDAARQLLEDTMKMMHHEFGTPQAEDIY